MIVCAKLHQRSEKRAKNGILFAGVAVQTIAKGDENGEKLV